MSTKNSHNVNNNVNPATPSERVPEAELDAFIRDVTKVHPMSKGEVRSRLEPIMRSYAQQYADRLIEETYKPVYYARTDKLMDWKEQTDLYCKARDDLRTELRSRNQEKGRP